MRGYLLPWFKTIFWSLLVIIGLTVLCTLFGSFIEWENKFTDVLDYLIKVPGRNIRISLFLYLILSFVLSRLVVIFAEDEEDEPRTSESSSSPTEIDWDDAWDR